jgi:hypothetical protein
MNFERHFETGVPKHLLLVSSLPPLALPCSVASQQKAESTQIQLWQEGGRKGKRGGGLFAKGGGSAAPDHVRLSYCPGLFGRHLDVCTCCTWCRKSTEGLICLKLE